MTDTTANIRSKGCETTGLTEEIARKLADGKPGKRLMAVVELEYVMPHGPDKEGKRKIDLVISLLEPAPSQMTEDHLRELTRSFHYERKLQTEGEELPLGQEGDEPTVEQVTTAGKALEPHDFVPTQEGDATICDVCGEDADDARHHIPADLEDEPSEEPAEPSAAEDEHHIHDPANPEKAGDKQLNPFEVVT
jgi:hypothetical protein